MERARSWRQQALVDGRSGRPRGGHGRRPGDRDRDNIRIAAEDL